MHRSFVLAAGLSLIAACAAGDLDEPEVDDVEDVTDDTDGQDDFDDPGANDDGGSDRTCAIVEVAAEPKTLDMIVLLDRSMSMDSSGKWGGATTALSSFFNDPTSTGINASLVFFPSPGVLTQDGPQCDVANYDPATSPHVALGALPTHAAELDTAMNAQTPDGFTPTQHALQGIVPFAMQRQADNPDHEVIIVVATDGIPAGCSNVTDQTIYNEAAAAAAAGVNLYAIAFDGARVDWVDGLAQAGGTNLGIDVTNDISQFQDAMDTIRDAHLGCSFDIPDPTETEFDKDKVNVTIDYMGTETELTKVESAEQCTDSTSWYFDDEDNPTTIHLCEGTCTDYGQTGDASIAIVFGCPTKLH